MFFKIGMGMGIPYAWIPGTRSLIYFVLYYLALHALSNAFAKSLAWLFCLSLIHTKCGRKVMRLIFFFTKQGYPLQNNSLGQLHSDGGIVSIVCSSA
jgi:hypothetical protein